MQVEKYLQEYQPVVYKTFLNAFQKDRLSHAYLISGGNGSPLLDVACFFAKSLLCDGPSPLACNKCVSCLRIEDGNYSDFYLFDGSKTKIKKDDVITIENAFGKTAMENKGVRVYILHLIENMTSQAINSILKLLEEPGKQIYAFLTTNNENLILPTIISRCQLLRLHLIDKEIVVNNAVQLGVERIDAELLSYFYNDADLIKETLDDKENNSAFFSAKECFEKVINVLNEGNANDVFYNAQSEIVNNIKNRVSCRFFINMLVVAFEDLINIKNQKNVFLESYATILENLVTKLSHLEESLIELLKCSGIVNTNVAIPLLIDHLFYTILKED